MARRKWIGSRASAGTTSCSAFDGDDVLDGGDGNDEAFGGHGNDSIDGGPGRDAFVYYASVENGADVITDFTNADDITALHGFAKADVTVRAEGSDTMVDLSGPDRITSRDVSEFDPNGILYDIKQIVR